MEFNLIHDRQNLVYYQIGNSGAIIISMPPKSNESNFILCKFQNSTSNSDDHKYVYFHDTHFLLHF